MKHIKQLSSGRPLRAALDLSTILTTLSQVMQVIGTMLVEKDAAVGDPYDYS